MFIVARGMKTVFTPPSSLQPQTGPKLACLYIIIGPSWFHIWAFRRSLVKFTTTIFEIAANDVGLWCLTKMPEYWIKHIIILSLGQQISLEHTNTKIDLVSLATVSKSELTLECSIGPFSCKQTHAIGGGSMLVVRGPNVKRMRARILATPT